MSLWCDRLETRDWPSINARRELRGSLTIQAAVIRRPTIVPGGMDSVHRGECRGIKPLKIPSCAMIVDDSPGWTDSLGTHNNRMMARRYNCDFFLQRIHIKNDNSSTDILHDAMPLLVFRVKRFASDVLYNNQMVAPMSSYNRENVHGKFTLTSPSSSTDNLHNATPLACIPMIVRFPRNQWHECQSYSFMGGDQTAEYNRRTMISALIMTFTERQTSP